MHFIHFYILCIAIAAFKDREEQPSFVMTSSYDDIGANGDHLANSLYRARDITTIQLCSTRLADTKPVKYIIYLMLAGTHSFKHFFGILPPFV